MPRKSPPPPMTPSGDWLPRVSDNPGQMEPGPSGRVKCNSTVSEGIHKGKYFGGAEGRKLEQEWEKQEEARRNKLAEQTMFPNENFVNLPPGMRHDRPKG